MKWNPIAGRKGLDGETADSPIARAKAAREVCDYLLDEVGRLGIEDAARLVDAAAAAIDDWLQQNKPSSRRPPRRPGAPR